METARYYKRKSNYTQADMDDSTSKKQNIFDIQADMISDLPSVVLYKIVECLPLRDAARTSVLSRKWHQIWTSIPSLVFDEQFFWSSLKLVSKVTHEFCGIVNKVLLQHEGPILKFSLSVTAQHNNPDFSQWMPYLVRNGLRDFSLLNMDMDYKSIEINSFLCSCGGLEKLKLQGCTLNHLPNFRGFPKLASLELDGVRIKLSTLNILIGSCPALEKLVLQNCIFREHRHLTIDAPNITNLVIRGALDSVDIKNGENLVSASIVMREFKLFSSKDCCDDLIKGLESFCKLEKLALGGRFCRVIFKGGYCSNCFENLRNLELISLQLDNLDDLLITINCIRSIPTIEMLKISVCTTENLDDNILDYNPDLTLNHLSCATVGIMSASSVELKLIEYILGCSPVLKKLTVSFNLPVKQVTTIKMLEQLNQFTRLSPQVKVVLGSVGSVRPWYYYSKWFDHYNRMISDSSQ